MVSWSVVTSAMAAPRAHLDAASTDRGGRRSEAALQRITVLGSGTGS
jgi:hypothetical protein